MSTIVLMGLAFIERSFSFSHAGDSPTLIPEMIQLQNDFSLHIVNYNSPGATGAPAYALGIVKKVSQILSRQ